MSHYVIGGNWKMQVLTVSEAVTIAKEIAQKLATVELGQTEVFIAPSFTALQAVGEAIKGTKLKLCAQNMYFRDQGAFTGEISPNSLLDIGCEYVLLGHSERRRIFGETSAQINQKAKKALEKGLKPVICIGETAQERSDGQMEAVNKQQLAESLADIAAEQVTQVIIAYEPVWAINNPFLNPGIEIKTATPDQADQMHTFIRQWLINQYGKNIGKEVPIQYGGSMKPTNCRDLLKLDDIDGGLIGGASLKQETFLPIVEAALNL